MADSDSDSGPPAKKTKKGGAALPVCPYGAKCYRKNPAHFKEYSHAKAGDATAKTSPLKSIDTSKLPVCSFGATCYRKNLLHYAEYSHPYTGGGPSAVPDDSGSDTEELESEDDKDTKKSKLKKGPSLTKNYSQMTETERRDLIKKAFAAKKELEKELEETKKQMAAKDKELDKLQDQINTGMLLVDGEKEALDGDKVVYFDLHAERAYKEGSADQIHFRLAESQFYRLLSGGYGANTKIKKVQYVVNPKLIKNLKEAREDLKKHRGEEFSYPVLAFHGTKDENITPIVEGGFKVPGAKGFTHRTDTGYYGCGVYFSEYPNYSMGYIAGSTRLLLCQVLPGKTFQCTTLIHGASLKKGYDSHISPCKKELVIFNSYHIYPTYIVHYTTSAKEFKYVKPPEERRRVDNKDELKKLYWKACKTKKSAILAGWIFKVHGKLCDTNKNIEDLVKKHGGTLMTTGGGTTGGGLFGGASTSYFTILVTTEAEFKKNGTWVQKATTQNATCVRQEFIFDCVIKSQKMEPEDYSLE